MSQGSSWFSWFTVPFFAPLSGAVTQDLSRHAYRGVPEIEADVVQNAGSFGRQLGILSEAVIDLTNRLAMQDPSFAPERAAATADDGEETPLGKLRQLVNEVDAIKDRHKAAAKREAEDALKRLQTIDPEAYEEVRTRVRPSAKP